MPAVPPAHQPTLAELQAAAATAEAAVADAQHRLEQARLDVYSAADAYYQAVVSITAPAPTIPKTAAAAVSPIDAAAAKLEKAVTAYQQIRRDLGLG